MTRPPVYDHLAEISIDLGGLLIETDAAFDDDSEWVGAELIEPRLTLTGWFCDDAWHDRAKLALIVGERRVVAAESRATEAWADTAEADRRDRLADETTPPDLPRCAVPAGPARRNSPGGDRTANRRGFLFERKP